MTYNYKRSRAKEAEIRRRLKKKKEYSVIESSTLIYDIAENKQGWVLASPISHHLYLSLSESTHTLMMSSWSKKKKNEKEIMFIV